MFEIGLSLREARTRQGLEFPEMETRTKVRAKYLRLLEEEQFDQLPAHTYVKGFLRTYADCLGLDGQLYVDEYNSRFVAVEDETQVRVRRAPVTTSRSRAQRRERRESRVVVLALAAIATVTALVIAAWRFGGPSGQDVHGLSSAGSGAPLAQHAQPNVVTVRALHGASFVVVRYRRSTGRPLFSGTLARGDVQAFPQRLLWVSITSPKNVVVTVYGKRISIPKSGDFQLTVPRR
jgi:cytoskeleton protein RodZ